MAIARESRHKVLIRATMRAGGAPMDVCIRDISSQGFLIQAGAPPPRGTYVELICADQCIVGRVAWGKDRRFGVRACQRVNVRALMGRLPASAKLQPEVPKQAARGVAAARTYGDDNRALAKAMEFAAVAALAAALVAGLGAAAFETLSRPLQDISGQLRGR